MKKKSSMEYFGIVLDDEGPDICGSFKTCKAAQTYVIRELDLRPDPANCSVIILRLTPSGVFKQVCSYSAPKEEQIVWKYEK